MTDANHSYGPSIKGATIGKSNRVDLVLIKTPAWMDQAKCVGHDPEWWHRKFGEWANRKPGAHLTGDDHYDNQIRAERLCATCPVSEECNQHGKTTRSTGLFGGEWLTGEQSC